MNYEKYLKYKFKYIELKNKINIHGGNINEKYGFKKDNTIIIVGVGPSLFKYKNIHKYFKDFDHLGLNDSIFFDDIKFKYSMNPHVCDLQKCLDIEDLIVNNEINDDLVNKYKKPNEYTLSKLNDYNKSGHYIRVKIDRPHSRLKEAITKKIKVILPRFKTFIHPWWYLPPRFKEIKQINEEINFEFVYRDDDKHLRGYSKIEINKSLENLQKTKYLGFLGTTCNEDAIIYSIMKNYKNIILTGISGDIKNFSSKTWGEDYVEIVKQINQYYPDVKIYCIEPNDKTKNIFHYDLYEKDFY